MLYGYPVSATQDNWVHQCLCQAIRNLHVRADTGPRARFPTWPKVLPAPRRSALRRRTALRDRLHAYWEALRKLTKAQRDKVLAALEDENRIEELLAGARDCTRISGLPKTIRKPVADLFGCGFDLLTELGIRDAHYAAIYRTREEHLCPFCGTEPFDAPGAPREDLDHYLAKSRYPFAAANLRNLVPMGHRCNSAYKLATDILRRENGSKRIAFDPYTHDGLKVVLDDSRPFAGSTAHTPKWVIKFSKSGDEVDTWDAVFSVRKRYCRDHLDPEFRGWLDFFAKVARSEAVNADSDAALVAALKRLEKYHGFGGLKDRAFLKAAAFRMLRKHCEDGHRRLLDQLANLVRGA